MLNSYYFSINPLLARLQSISPLVIMTNSLYSLPIKTFNDSNDIFFNNKSILCEYQDNKQKQKYNNFENIDKRPI